MMSNNPIVVNSVAEEYEYISRQRCECGGAFKVIRQSFEPVPFEHDTLTAKCTKCLKETGFTFDVSRFFDKQGEDILFKKFNIRRHIMNNPFLEIVKEALKSEGKALSQEDQKLLLRDSELTVDLSDNEKEVLSFVSELLFRNFFNNVKAGYYYCDPAKIKEYHHESPEDRLGGIKEGMLYQLFVAYYTLKIKILDWGKQIGDNIVNTVLLDEIVRGVETELAACFFPTPGPVNFSPMMRLVSIKSKLENYASSITFDEIFEVRIPCGKCKAKLRLYAYKGLGRVICPNCKQSFVFNPIETLQLKVVADMCEIWKNRRDLLDKSAETIWNQERDALERERRESGFDQYMQ